MDDILFETCRKVRAYMHCYPIVPISAALGPWLYVSHLALSAHRVLLPVFLLVMG